MGYFSKLGDPGTAQHLAERCRDDYCQRLPCRMYKAGYEAGYQQGWIDKPPDIVYVEVSSS